MKKEEEKLIRFVQPEGEIIPDRPVYRVEEEDYETVRQILDAHPDLKAKYFLGNGRLINTDFMKQTDRDFVLTWQSVDGVKDLIKRGVLDNPHIRVRMLLDRRKDEVARFPQIRKSLEQYYDSIFSIVIMRL